jgi:DNA-binding CsgD family transcriptional regulator
LALSDREWQVAMMMIKGQNPNEMATILTVSVNNINCDRYWIFDTFSINSDIEWVLFAIKHHFFGMDLVG